MDLNAKNIKKIHVIKIGMERCMLGISRQDWKCNTWVISQTNVTDIIHRVAKWEWVGHHIA